MEQFKQLLAAVRPDVLRFARIQLRDEDLAEDMVQEALAAAIGKREQFRSDSGLKTWVISILKNKIRDHFRSLKNTVSLDEWQEDNGGIEAAYADSFDSSGHWLASSAPQAWNAEPEVFTGQQEFRRALENCLHGLPQDTARIFYLREVMGMEVDEICAEFSISRDNCYVILHRARNGLRHCLQHRWFDYQE
ncbi:MAG: sigma-70 family RNA polymerase sigma factor [Neisseria sp.]|nr:sigma-70 family RNA polymerase sigma factor [Neisseria sp.]